MTITSTFNILSKCVKRMRALAVGYLSIFFRIREMVKCELKDFHDVKNIWDEAQFSHSSLSYQFQLRAYAEGIKKNVV
jgi:hypothetical protein